MSNTEITTFEQATALTGKKAIDFFSDSANIYPLIEFVKTEALSLVPNVQTKKGRDEIGSAALKVSRSRKALEEAINKSVSDLKSKVQKSNEVKKIVVSELNQTREEVLKPRNEWQLEQDRIEVERVSEIKGRIANIESIGTYAMDEDKESLAHRVDALAAMDVSEGFSEFTADAVTAIASATKSLNDRILHIIEEEKAESQRKQLEVEKKKNLIQDRLTNLVQIPLGLMGKNSTEIQAEIDNLQAFSVLEDDFEERTEEAKNSLSQVVSQLGMLLNQAKQIEEVKAEADRLQREAEDAKRATNAVELSKQLSEDIPVKHEEVVHPSDCKGCPDCQGINCEVTNQACKEELGSPQVKYKIPSDDADKSKLLVVDIDPSSITMNSHPELFEELKDGCDFDTSEVPKHGKGYVIPEAEYEGKLYRYNMEIVWDHSWGIEEWFNREGAWLVVNPIEYDRIELRLAFLDCLICAGVDNWSGGYDYAVEEFLEQFPDEEVPR